MSEETVTITLALYKHLEDEATKLHALEFHGVEHWQWYDTAMETYEQMKGAKNE